MLLSSYAPLWPWLKSALDAAPVFLTGGPAHLGMGPLGDVETADCRPLAVRAQILATLDAHGHRFSWALGSIWSGLTDEQAGRLTAEIVRRVGRNPEAPSHVLPTGLLSLTRRRSGAGMFPGVYNETRHVVVGQSPIPYSEGGGVKKRGAYGPGGWRCGAERGPETGDAGREKAEASALSQGAVMLEQVTP